MNLILLLYWFLSSFYLAAAEEAPKEVELVVKGNKVLSDQSIGNISGINQVPDLSAREVKERLRSTSLFSEIHAARDQDALTIFVREKTSWFALPYFSSDSDSKIFGAAAGKSGLWGDDGSLVGRYQAGTGDREASLLLRDEYTLGTFWIAAVSFDYEDSLHRVFKEREISTRTLNHYAGGSIQAGYHLTPYLSLGFNTYIEQHRFEELNGEYFEGIQVSHRLLGNLSNLSLNEGLTTGLAVQLYIESSDPLSDFRFRKYGILSQLGVFRYGNLNWITRPRLEGGAALNRYQLFELGGGKLRSFPSQNFRGALYFSTQNDLLLASIDVWKLKLRPLLYTDWAFIQSSGRTGFGAGFQVFFRDVAVPALQFFAGYGFNPNGFSASAAIGPSL